MRGRPPAVPVARVLVQPVDLVANLAGAGAKVAVEQRRRRGRRRRRVVAGGRGEQADVGDLERQSNFQYGQEQDKQQPSPSLDQSFFGFKT